MAEEHTVEDVIKLYKETGSVVHTHVPEKMPLIKGYWHIWLKNKWQDVVIEQLQKLTDSGLYDACDSIHCGVLGNNKELFKLMQIFNDYPKITIAEISTNEKLYEFQTINTIKIQADIAKEDYYLFYIHLKGISFSLEENVLGFHGGNFWRRHMEEYTITKWKDNVAELDKGYEVCGTQWRARTEFPVHYSGNMWWSRSEYIKILPAIAELNLMDRMSAEFWIGMKHPFAATLSQEFVDYYTPEQEGLDYSPIKKKMKKGRNIVHTLCWNLTSEVERAVKSLYELNDKNDFEHYLIGLNFPLLKGDEIPYNIEEAKEINSKELRRIADKYGSTYIEIENKGVSGNWSQVTKLVKLTDNDVLMCCDSDEHIQTKNWVRALSDVIRGDENIVVTSLIMEEQTESFTTSNSILKSINGIRVFETIDSAMWAICAISGKFINEIGGVPYPKDFPIYGHLEGALIHFMREKGKKWAMLRDFYVVHSQQEKEVPLLREWKNTIIFRKDEFKRQIPFDEFLQMKKDGTI